MGKLIDSYKEYVEKIQSRKIVLFCAGKKCITILDEFFRYPYDEIAFICDNDSSKWGDKIYNLDICAPEILRKKPDDYIVIITVYDDYILKRVEEQLLNMDVKNCYSSAILMFANRIERYNPDGTRKLHELNTYNIINKNMDKIQSVLEMLEDDKSKEVYMGFVEKMKYNLDDYKDLADDLYDHYFSDEIFQYKNEEVLVDGGAFDGDDTIRFDSILARQNKRLGKALCFEPDTKNFGKTYKNLEKYYGENVILDENRQIASAEHFIVFKAGLFDKKCGIGFCEYGAHSSRFTQDDVGASVDAVLLDDIAKDEAVTFIKYDLEGADIAALKGAEQTIKKCKPKLALSIYHNIEDLWEIPIMIKEMVPEYKFFIRHHTIYEWDKILYAGIEEDLA